MIQLTDLAVQKVLEYMSNDPERTETTGLRIQVLPGGCSGLKHNIVITDEVESDDEIITLMSGVKVYIDPWSAQYLNGTVVDFKTSLTSSGFVFNNPNSTGGCGCGESFNV